jgi:molecular chaperone GrpE
MTNDRNQHSQTIAPGDPEAPVPGSKPGPAPAEAPHVAPRQQHGHHPHAGSAAHAGREHHPASEPKVGGVVPDPADVRAAGEGDVVPGNEVEELAAKAVKADEYLTLAQRTQADFENYRKRAVREAAVAQERGVAKLAKELLPAVDNLDRALAAAEGAAVASLDGDADATLVSGIKLVHAEVLAALARAGIEPYSPIGELFDPQWHEAVAQQPFQGAPPGTIVEVYQSGYRLGDNVLRPARVVVAG